jgi:hypothetical protein
MASKAFTTVPRTVLFVMEDPGDETGRRRVLSLEKCNVGRRDAAPRAFAIDEVTVAANPDDGRPVTTGVLRWTGETPSGTVPAMLAAAQHGPARVTAADRAADWLDGWLAQRENRSATVGEVRAAAEAAGHAWRTVGRGRADIGVIAENTKMVPPTTVWMLPAMPVVPASRVHPESWHHWRQENVSGTTTPTWPAESPVCPVVPTDPPLVPVVPTPESPREAGTTGAPGCPLDGRERPAGLDDAGWAALHTVCCGVPDCPGPGGGHG